MDCYVVLLALFLCNPIEKKAQNAHKKPIILDTNT